VTVSVLVNTTYSGAVSFLNESVTPVDVTYHGRKEEVRNISRFSGSWKYWSLIYADADGNGKPIGLAFILRT
jgi:hypothetical protein